LILPGGDGIRLDIQGNRRPLDDVHRMKSGQTEVMPRKAEICYNRFVVIGFDPINLVQRAFLPGNSF
jgi:hypothetical protein